MAAIQLTINTNFSDAERALRNFGNQSQQTSQQIIQSQNAIRNTNVDNFIQRQQRLADAVSVTRGGSEAMIMIQRNLRNEYERLYRQGVDPNSQAMQRLNGEYQRVTAEIERNNAAMQASARISEMSSVAMMGVATAAVAVSGALIANTIDIAQSVDAMTESAMSLGLTTREYQSLLFVAERTGASMQSMDNAIQKMNVGIGQARTGTGALHKMLSENNPALLEQVMNAENSANAFALLAAEVGKTENPMDRAALASAAFGKGNRDIINTAVASGDSIRGIVAEAERYGLVSESLEEKSGAWDDAQKNLSASIMGVRFSLAEKLMPAMTLGMQKIADLISNTDKLKILFTVAVPVIAALTTGIIAFGIATKGVAVATTILTAAQAAFNAVMALNPAVLIITAIVMAIAGLVTAIVLIRKNWDTVVWGWEVGTNKIKIALGDMVLMILDKVVPTVVSMYELMAKIPGPLGKMFGLAAKGVEMVSDKIEASTIAMQKNSEEAIKNADIKYDAAKKAAAAAELEKKKKTEQVVPTEPVVPVSVSPIVAKAIQKAEPDKIGTGVELTALEDKLKLFENTTAVSQQKMIEQYNGFYSARMEQEKVNAEGEVAFIIQEQNRILALKILEKDQVVALEKATADRINAIQESMSVAQYERQKQRLSSMAGFFQSLQQIAENTGLKSRLMAQVLKGIALAEIGINTKRAIMQIWADQTLPTVAKIPATITAGSAGIAAATGVISQKIPSAETGMTDFIVPDGTRVDSSFVRVNQGEKLSVTPRGESVCKTLMVKLIMDSRELFSAVQEGVDSGQVIFSGANV